MNYLTKRLPKRVSASRMAIAALLVTMVLWPFLSCKETVKQKKETPVFIDFSGPGNAGNPVMFPKSDSVLKVAIAAIISPAETYVYYRDLLNYISKKIHVRVVYRQKKTYREINNLILHHQVDMAFICSGSYIELDTDKVKILVVPVSNGKPYYRGYIITNVNSGINKFRDLKGKSFAFTDPGSNTGFTYAKKLVEKNGGDINTYFSKTVFTYAHDISIQMVEKNLVAGATVDGLIYEYLKKHSPERVKDINIIQKSVPYGIPPVVVPASINKVLELNLRHIMLNLHHDPVGAAMLKKLMIDRFILAGDTLYNSLRNE